MHYNQTSLIHDTLSLIAGMEYTTISGQPLLSDHDVIVHDYEWFTFDAQTFSAPQDAVLAASLKGSHWYAVPD